MTGGGFVGVVAACACMVVLGCGEEPRADPRPAPVGHESRGVANVLLVVDTSEEMGGERLERARAGLDELVRAVPPSDRVGLARFSAGFEPLVPVTEMKGNRDALRRAIAGLRAAGPSAVYDATLQAYGLQRELAGGRRLNAVIVLAHGDDSASRTTYERVRKLLGSRVSVTTIAYDTTPASGLRAALTGFSRASGGVALTATPENLGSVLRRAWRTL